MTQCMKENIFLLFDMHDMHALTVILVCAPQVKKTLSISRYDTLQTLTVISSHSVLFTPCSSSNFRQCSHSNNVLHPNIQSSEKSGVWGRWDWMATPWLRITCSVLHLILSDGQFTLGSGPGHIRNKIPIFHWLGHQHTSDFEGTCQRDVRMKSPFPDCSRYYNYNAKWLRYVEKWHCDQKP